MKNNWCKYCYQSKHGLILSCDGGWCWECCKYQRVATNVNQCHQHQRWWQLHTLTLPITDCLSKYIFSSQCILYWFRKPRTTIFAGKCHYIFNQFTFMLLLLWRQVPWILFSACKRKKSDFLSSNSVSCLMSIKDINKYILEHY